MPRNTAGISVKIVLCAQLARRDEGSDWISRLLDLQPGLTVADLKAYAVKFLRQKSWKFISKICVRLACRRGDDEITPRASEVQHVRNVWRRAVYGGALPESPRIFPSEDAEGPDARFRPRYGSQVDARPEKFIGFVENNP